MTVSTKRLSMFLLAVCAFPLYAAESHRRAAAPAIPLVKIHGKVTDAATGAPVRFADIANTPRTAQTDADGNYEIEVPLGLPASIQVTRSGYETASTSIIGTGGVETNFTLKSKPTVTMKLTDGTTYNLDYETAQFAVEIPFANSARSDNALLCSTDGAQSTLNKTDISKIIGPGVAVNNAACCKSTTVVKLTINLKSGAQQDALLADTCTGSEMDFSGRDHVTGQFIYKRFKDIAEIDFP
jgi:hypothetical protein